MADDEINPQGEAEEGMGASLEKPTPEELAAFNQALEALAKMDLSKEFKASGLSFETAPDGTLSLKMPEGMSDDALLNSALLGAETFDTNPESVNGDQDMGLFDKHRICVCSEVTGILTQDGKPVAGAEIVRRCDLFLPKDDLYIDVTVTDADGRFDFPPRYAKKWKHILSEVRTDQKILIRHEGKQYLGWANTSMGRDLHHDIFHPLSEEGQYFRLDFKGDLARGTPLPEDADLNSNLKEEGLFNSQVVCVATYLNFFVTMKGEPAVGAKVVRMAEHVGHGSYEQSKLTDRDGEVSLPTIWASRLEYRWAKFEIKQKIVITYEGKEYLAWEKTKTNPWEEGEYNLDDKRWGLPVDITAELSDDPYVIRGMKTDTERRGVDDNLPEDAIPYKGLFQVTRFNPCVVIEDEDEEEQ